MAEGAVCRCHKVVSLIHVNRSLDLFLTVAARVVPGNRHECPILYELVDIDTIVPLKKNMNAYQDVMGLTRLKDFAWEPYQQAVCPAAGSEGPAATADPAGGRARPKHPTIVKRELTRQRTLAKKKGLP